MADPTGVLSIMAAARAEIARRVRIALAGLDVTSPAGETSGRIARSLRAALGLGRRRDTDWIARPLEQAIYRGTIEAVRGTGGSPIFAGADEMRRRYEAKVAADLGVVADAAGRRAGAVIEGTMPPLKGRAILPDGTVLPDTPRLPPVAPPPGYPGSPADWRRERRALEPVTRAVRSAAIRTAAYRAGTVVDTALNHAAQQSIIAQTPADMLLLWITQQDSRVRPTHRRRNMRAYTPRRARQLIGEPNCRCALRPVPQTASPEERLARARRRQLGMNL